MSLKHIFTDYVIHLAEMENGTVPVLKNYL